MTMTDKQRPVVPPTEVRPKATRRTFSAEYKARILAEADSCTKPGEVGALLRREGLYSSHLTEWRGLRKQAEIAALAPKKRGPVPAPPPDARDREIEELKSQLAPRRSRASTRRGRSARSTIGPLASTSVRRSTLLPFLRISMTNRSARFAASPAT